MRSRLNSLRSSLNDDSPAEAWSAYLSLARRVRQWADGVKIELAEERASAKQLAFAQAFHDHTHHVYAAIGGNRSGKTVATVWLCFAKHLRDVARPGSTFWAISPTFEKSITLQREFTKVLPKAMLGSQTWNPKRGFGLSRVLELNLPAGGQAVIKFKSADQPDTSFEADKLAGVLIDETIPEALYDRVQARLLDLGGWMLISTIPDAGWMNFRLKKARPEEKVLFRQFAMIDNLHNLHPEAVQRATAGMTAEEVDMRVHGNFRFLQGLVYKEFDEAVHVVRPFAIPASWPKVRGIDYGAAHPTVCLWFAIAPNDTLYVYREYVQRQASIEHHARRILAMSGDEVYVARTIIDPSAYHVTAHSPKSIAQQYDAAGVICQPGIRSNKYGEYALVQAVKQRLIAGRLKVFATCEETIREFGAWRYKLDADGHPSATDSFADKDNDALDVVKYVVNHDLHFHPPLVMDVSSLHD